MPMAMDLISIRWSKAKKFAQYPKQCLADVLESLKKTKKNGELNKFTLSKININDTSLSSQTLVKVRMNLFIYGPSKAWFSIQPQSS